MQCTSPIHGYYARRTNPTGKRSVVFTQAEGYVDKPVSLPCGKCLGCRLEYARQWAVRCEHELKLREENCFITLTYDDEWVPKSPSGLLTLSLDDVTKFWKRLRERVEPLRIRYFQCGEYGETTGRPHYHAIVFGWWPADGLRDGDSSSGEQLFSSKFLEEVWGYGRCTVQEANFKTANYTARYVTKKQVDKKDGSDDRMREFLTMSRKPGIGHDWAMRYMEHWYSRDRLVSNGHEMRPPAYYDRLCAKRMPWLEKFVKAERRKSAAEVEYKRVTDTQVSHHAVAVVRAARTFNLKRNAE